MYIKCKNMEEAYKKAIRMVYLFGEEVSPRGSKTLELAPAIIEIENPRQLLAAPPDRKINPCFGLAETLWFLRGSNDLEEIAHYNSVWRYFEDKEDNPGILNGAYGNRLRKWGKGEMDQLVEVYKKLKKDPYSRQAIMVIFDPERDNKILSTGSYSKDIPCTSYFNFQIRDGKLNMQVVMRSNDLHKGFIYDAHNFMLIQNLIAGWLNVEVGKYTHYASSLHIYMSDLENLKKCMENPGESLYKDLEEIPDIKMDIHKYFRVIHLIREIEKISRKMVNAEDKEKEYKYDICLNRINLINNKFWEGVGACFLVYNSRKARLPKEKWIELVEKYIKGTEYYRLFVELSDLSDK